MKHTILALLLLVTSALFSQTIDTVITSPHYKAYVSKKLKQPVYVKYVIYKGGGDCERSDRWTNPTTLPLLNHEYSHSGYDRGHLANAEDFAYDCALSNETFRLYNCLPQTPALNRGVWKQWETKIRHESQTDSLLVICGGIWETSTVKSKMRIPTKCWKVVYNLRTHTVVHALVFTNTLNPTYVETTIQDINMRLGFNLELTF